MAKTRFASLSGGLYNMHSSWRRPPASPVLSRPGPLLLAFFFPGSCSLPVPWRPAAGPLVAPCRHRQLAVSFFHTWYVPGNSCVHRRPISSAPPFFFPPLFLPCSFVVYWSAWFSPFQLGVADSGTHPCAFLEHHKYKHRE